jgi:hypothetical protein
MSSASEQLLYAINNLTETLGDLTGLLTEVIAEEYELDGDDPDPGEDSEPAQLMRVINHD